ncbi:MAG: DNA polymerase/3'-5' exonuclease PolX [Actinobacteria bacterium]|nr:DNA polymerase/3'-5' exonuclease PolX [Actinomycetota bacterium]
MSMNAEAARLLQELANLTKLVEGSPQSFKVRAYEKAAGVIRDLPSPIEDMSIADMQKLDGIGKATASKLREWIDTGSIEKLDVLRREFPAAFVELTKIPGLGPKTVVMLRDVLGVNTVDDLRDALDEQALRGLPGMGEKTETKIRKGIDRLGLHGKDRRTPIAVAMELAVEFVTGLRQLPQVDRAMYCGSLRRFSDTVGDVDITAVSQHPDAVMDAFVNFPAVRSVIARGTTKSSVLTAGDLQVDLRVVPEDSWGAAILYFTGSKAHNIELRQRAIDRGWTLNEYSLADVDSGAVIASRTEEEIYRALDMVLVPPEMREGVGEVAAAAADALPDPLVVADIRGDLHVHSTWSGDGRSSLQDMLDAAHGRGLSYVAMTEHAEDLAINGLSRQRVLEMASVLEELRPKYPAMTVLQGAELNIGRDGSVDYDADFLTVFDWCVASVHSHFDLSVSEQTERIIGALHNPAVHAIGHLTGRKIGTRPGISLDFDAVLDAAAETGTALEINSHLQRLDVPADWLRRARDRTDVLWVISTDAHEVSEFDNITWGAAQARRGWVPKAQVVNTWPAEEFLSWIGYEP